MRHLIRPRSTPWKKSALMLAVASACLLVGCSRNRDDAVAELAKDNIVRVESEDPEMTAAIAEARRTLPKFWEAFDSRQPGADGFALKVEIEDPNGTEHFWAGSLERKDGKIFGTIDNRPNIVKSVRFGERIEIPDARISDWTYMRGGKMYGNRTMRPLLKTMPDEEAKILRAMLAEP